MLSREEIIKNFEIRENPPAVFLKTGKDKKMILDYRRDSPIQKITVIPTGECNLNCSYCITKKERKYIKEKVSYKDVCNFIKKYCKKNQKIVVNFSGGGEPTKRMDFIKKIVSDLKKYFKFVKFGITTNGVLSRKSLDWLIENMDAINVSCDGPREIQDRQRPLKGGGGSSRIVEKNLKRLVKKRTDFKVRTLITDPSEKNIEKIIRYFFKLGVRNIVLSHEAILGGNFLEKQRLFLKNTLNYIEMLDIYRMNYPNFIGSFINLCNIRTENPGFVLTPDGYVSVCPNVWGNIRGKEDFIVGKFGSSGCEIDKEKYRKLVPNDPKKNLIILGRGCAYYERFPMNKKIKNLADETLKKYFHDYLVYQVHKNFIRIKPYIREGKNLEFEMVFNRFKLGDNEFRENPYMRINPLVFNEVFGKMENYERKNPSKIFFLSFYLMNSKKVLDFLEKMNEKKLGFLVTTPVFPCKEVNFVDREKIKEFNIPVSCRDCLELYRITEDGKVRFCTGQAGKDLSEYDTRKEIYEEFLKLDNRLSGACKNCIHKLRGNCDGKYCE